MQLHIHRHLGNHHRHNRQENPVTHLGKQVDRLLYLEFSNFYTVLTFPNHTVGIKLEHLDHLHNHPDNIYRDLGQDKNHIHPAIDLVVGNKFGKDTVVFRTQILLQTDRLYPYNKPSNMEVEL
jgi:hypothetical protein